MPDFCKTCRAPLLWATTPSGASDPIDREPVEDGNTLLLRSAQLNALIAITLSGKMLSRARGLQVPLRKSHWATCPDRAQHREETDRKRARGAS